MEIQPINEVNANNETIGSAENRYLVFTIAEQEYAIEINFVIEIIEVLPTTRVPFLPECMKGIVNLRGNIIPIMDVRLRFGLEEAEYTDRTCLLVIDNDGVQLALVVDSVKEVANIPENMRMIPPSMGDIGSAQYIKCVGNVNGEVQLILDCNRLMDI